MFSKHVRRLFTTAMTFTLALSLSITASASSVTGNVGGGGTGGMSSTTDYKAWSANDSGYRFYIVDENLERVTDVYDFLFTTPDHIGEQFYSTRFDGPNSPTIHDSNNTLSISVLASLSGSNVSEIPYPVKNNKGLGEEFKKWFLKGLPYAQGGSGAVVINPTQPNKNNSNNSENSDTSNSNSQTENPDTDEMILSGRGQMEYTMATGITLISFDNISNSLSSEDKTDALKYLNNAIGLYKTKCDAVYLNYPTWDYNDILLLNLGQMYYGNIGGLGYEQKLFICTYIWENRDTILVGTDIYNSKYASIKKNSLLNSIIPLSGESSVMNAPAIILLNEKNAIAVNGYETALEALMDEHYLVVEPLVWIYINTGGSNYEATKTYGSYYNIANKWNSLGGKDGGAFYASYMTKLGNNCMTVNSSITTSTGATLGAAAITKRNVSVSVSEMETSGLSMHIYSSDMFSESGTSTYDELLGKNPGPAPDPTYLPEETEYAEKSKIVTIIKNYVEVIDGSEHTIGNWTRVENPHIISIEDEPKFKVVDWNTSINNPVILEDGSKKPWAQLIYNSSKNQEGTTVDKITLSKDEVVLFVKLLKQSETVDNQYNASVVLEQSELSKSVTVGTELSSQEVVYKLGELDPCIGHCDGHCAGFKYDHSSSCIACSICGASGAWLSRCNGTLADGSKCTNTGNGWGYGKCNDSKHGTSGKCTDLEVSEGKCNHTKVYCDNLENCENKVYCEEKLDNTDLNFNRENNNRKNSLIALTDNFDDKVSDSTHTRKSLSEYEITENYNYSYVLHRGSNDKAILSKYNSESGNSLANELFSSALVPVGRLANGVYGSDMKIALVEKNADKETSAVGEKEECVDTDEATTESNNPSVTEKIAIKVYKGKQRNPDTSIDYREIVRLTTQSNDMTSGHMVSTSSSIKFYPYVRMTIQNLFGNKQPVNVLGEYQREILPNNYAEVSWKIEDNLKIDSSLFALDKGLTSGDKGWNYAGSVLKGGASYILNTKPSRIELLTYQTILGDNSSNISNISGERNLTENEAIQEHQQFVDAAILKFDTTEIAQYVNKKYDAKTAWDGGIKVYSGANIKDLKNGSNKASTDDKYYLDTDINNNKNIQRNDLDVNILGTLNKFYRFYSDISGNIYMVEGSSISEVENNVGSIILTKSQGVDSLRSTAKLIDNKTYVIRKLLAAIERNTGNDATASWVSDGRWYNEAYSGIIIMVQRTGLDIGFNNGLRNTVLDPKLIPIIDSKYDQGTTAFLMQYKAEISEDEPISYFMGEPIYMYGADEWFTSNKVFITNMTVQGSR